MQWQRTLLLIALPILAAAMAAITRGAPRDEGPKKVATRNVPLKSVYSTSRQKELKLIDQGTGDAGFSNEMRELYKQATRMGASNVFLARGDDIAAAVKATWEVFRQGQSAAEPVSADQRSKSAVYWLVAYLGVAGSQPLEWQVKSIQLTGEEVRLTYTKVGARTNDLHPYFVWVSLGKIKAGTYTLELFDEDLKRVTLLRSVTASAK